MDWSFTSEQLELQAKVREFARTRLLRRSLELEWQQPAESRVPWELVEAADAMGLRMAASPKEYGGLGAGPVTMCLLIEELAAEDMGFAAIIDQTWKTVRIFNELANDEQRRWFFERLGSNPRGVLAMAATEADLGSDWFSGNAPEARFSTKATWDGSGWVLNGRKQFISNGADADVYLVFACTNRECGIREGSSLFILPRETSGFVVTQIHEKMGQRTINNAVMVFENVRLPDSAMLGERDTVFSDIAWIARESNIEAAATCLGAARGAYEHASEWARTCPWGDGRLADRGTVKLALSDMLVKLEAARSLTYRCAWLAECEEHYDVKWSSISKVFAADTAVEICVKAMDLFGEYGCLRDLPAQKYLRDALSFLHSDGTQDIHSLRLGAMVGAEPIVEPNSPVLV